MYERWVSEESMKENCPGKESLDLQEDTIRLEGLSGVLVVDTNQWLLIQKAFAAQINVRLGKLFQRYTFIRFSNVFIQ